MVSPNQCAVISRRIETVPMPGHAIRAVVVDDTPSMLQALSFILGRDPLLEVVGEAMDGVAAVGLVRSVRPDLVVMDINMPRMDGTEAASLIKNIRPETKIILVSAEEDTERVLAALESGADGFIPKQRFNAEYSRQISMMFDSVRQEPLR